MVLVGHPQPPAADDRRGTHGQTPLERHSPLVPHQDRQRHYRGHQQPRPSRQSQSSWLPLHPQPQGDHLSNCWQARTRVTHMSQRRAGWMVSMTSRQIGHFFFEPKGYDAVNDVTHEYKEEVKVGYNLHRKVVLLSLWALSPLPLYFKPTFFGMIRPWKSALGFIHQIGMCWLFIGVARVILRSIQLFFIRDLQTGLV